MEEQLTKAQEKELRHQKRQEWEANLKKQAKFARYKKIGFWGIGIIVCGLAVWGLISVVNTPQPSQNQTLTLPPLNSSDISKGPQNAKVTFVEYADFQCPACGYYYPLTKQLEQDFNGKVRFVYRFFPLESHQFGFLSAQAAYAALLQGKFWEMHDMLFANQKDWAVAADARPIFIDYAKKLGLNVQKFQQDMDADSTKTFLKNEEQKAMDAGVDATPTFFINGKSIQPNGTYDNLKQLIQNAFNK